MKKFLFKDQGLLFNLYIPFFCFGFIFLIMPIAATFQFDSDEGQEMVKAILYSQGFTLYGDIWSDQPPLFTFLLSHWFNVFGDSVFAARLLVLCFATLLIWSFAQILRLSLGTIPAIIGITLLMFSINFMRLSVSIMIGLPSLTLALVSLYFLFLYQYKNLAANNLKTYLAIFSGMAFGLSLQLKMYTIFLFPLILFYWLEQRKSQDLKTKFLGYYPAILWSFSFLGTFLIVGIALNSLDLQNFFQFHLTNSIKNAFPNENSFHDVLMMYLQGFDYVLLAILGVGKIWKSQESLAKLPLIWLILATVILLNHKPIWYHHYLLLSIPLVWLATYGMVAAIQTLQKDRWFAAFQKRKFSALFPIRYTAIALIFSLLALPIKLSFIGLQNQQFIQESKDHQEVLQHLVKYRDSTHWIFTDTPMYAAYAGINVPPEIATLSRKRIVSQEINNDFLKFLFTKYSPEQCLIEKLPELEPTLDNYLGKDYSKVRYKYKNYWAIHYVKND
ncbi:MULTISPECIES: glycosyltransferase family 39 protein [Spirulina sp. CCY15215]|uniref:ArnT family glycosyltransferase n=1 Tax=Spirulina sp. CCY15215 TaxID=2767591 RepID=UPI00194E087D|nr:glycosyltransferase family 39 protein [Spirulina major]